MHTHTHAERESEREGREALEKESSSLKRLDFSPPSLFPAHVQLLTALMTPQGWRQKQTDRRRGRTRRYFIKHPAVTLTDLVSIHLRDFLTRTD